MNSWPDGGTTPFRSEKNTNWEGAFRVPCLIRWPGVIKPGTVSNEIVSALDWMPTLVAAAGDAGRQGQAAQGPPGRRQDLQGPSRRLQPAAVPAPGQQPTRARARSSSTSTTTAISCACATRTGRSCSWSNARRARCGSGPSRSPRCASPSYSTCAADPYERADITSNTYYDWHARSRLQSCPAQADVADSSSRRSRSSRRSQRPASFSIDQVHGEAAAEPRSGGG